MKWTENEAIKFLKRNKCKINKYKHIKLGEKSLSNKACGARSFLINHCGYKG